MNFDTLTKSNVIRSMVVEPLLLEILVGNLDWQGGRSGGLQFQKQDMTLSEFLDGRCRQASEWLHDNRHLIGDYLDYSRGNGIYNSSPEDCQNFVHEFLGVLGLSVLPEGISGTDFDRIVETHIIPYLDLL